MGKSRSQDFLRGVFLEDPETHERARIIHVEGAEEGHDHLRIIARSAQQRENGLAMLYRVYAEEITWPPESKAEGGDHA